jgi:hypothetical protein
MIIQVKDLEEYNDMFTVVNVVEGIEHFRAIPLMVGTKIECREDILNNLKNEPYIQVVIKYEYGYDIWEGGL